MINSTMSVRELATQIPESTRLFETLRIDYCWGADRSLVEACEVADVEADDVIAMLTVLRSARNVAPDRVDFQKLSLTELITHILRTHHIFMKSQIERLEELTEKVVKTHGTNHLELLRVDQLVRQLCDELKPHMYKEERILFPYIQKLELAAKHQQRKPLASFGTVQNPIRVMMREHDDEGHILRELRLITSEYKLPKDACINYQALFQALEAFEKDLHQHIHLENNILVPRAERMEASAR